MKVCALIADNRRRVHEYSQINQHCEQGELRWHVSRQQITSKFTAIDPIVIRCVK